MKRLFIVSLTAGLLFAGGIRPRGRGADYPAHQTIGGVTVGAAVVPPEQVRKLFATDLNSAGYVVVEIAIYPERGQEIDVSSADFMLRIGSDASVPAARPRAVAAQLERKNDPRRIDRNVDVYPSATIGYESGRDPVTGQRRSGVYTGGGVTVAGGTPSRTGGGGPIPTDPALMREELEQLALPEEKTTRTVAGYLYFPKPPGKLKKMPYELTYYARDAQFHLSVPRPDK